MKTREDKDRRGEVGFGDRHMVDHWTGMLNQLTRSLFCVGKVTCHAGGGSKKVHVVTVIHHVVHTAGRAALSQIHAVNHCPVLCAARRGGVVADAHEDVRGHMNEMPRGGHKRLQPCSAGNSSLRMSRSLHSVDVIVVRSDMLWITPQHGFQ